MTCAEFRQKNGTNAEFNKMTRAERALCAVHYYDCPECREFVEKLPDNVGSPLGLSDDDMADQEFVAVVRPAIIRNAETLLGRRKK